MKAIVELQRSDLIVIIYYTTKKQVPQDIESNYNQLCSELYATEAALHSAQQENDAARAALAQQRMQELQARLAVISDMQVPVLLIITGISIVRLEGFSLVEFEPRTNLTLADWQQVTKKIEALQTYWATHTLPIHDALEDDGANDLTAATDAIND